VTRICSFSLRPSLLLVNVQCDIQPQLKKTEGNYDSMIMTVITLLLFYFDGTRCHTHNFYMAANWYIVQSALVSAID